MPPELLRVRGRTLAATLAALLSLGLLCGAQARITPPPSQVQYAASVSKSAPALDRLYAALGRAQNAASTGNMPLAQEQLRRAQSVSQGLGGRYKALAEELTELRGRSVVTAGDVQGALGLLGNLERQGAGQRRSALLGLGADLSSLSTWKLPLSVLVALLASVPLYLFGRTFGRSPSWRGLWLGLALLMLPSILDGLLVLLGGVGALMGWGPLRALLAFPSWQNAWGWLPRGLCLVTGVGLWAYFLRQIAVQFGVLGKVRKKVVTLTEIKSSSPWDLD